MVLRRNFEVMLGHGLNQFEQISVIFVQCNIFVNLVNVEFDTTVSFGMIAPISHDYFY
jgi:hypothetical protein